MSLVILIVHVLAAVCVIGLVLMQHGKGADMGAAFGSGSANFLSRSTAIFAVVFFLSSMGLSYLSFEKSRSVGIMSTQELQQVPVDSGSEVPVIEREPGGAAGDESKVNEIPK